MTEITHNQRRTKATTDLIEANLDVRDEQDQAESQGLALWDIARSLAVIADALTSIDITMELQ